MVNQRRMSQAAGRPVLGEPITWRLLVRRFREADNRPLAAWNLTRHAGRALWARLHPLIHPLRRAAHEVGVQTRIALAYPFGFLHSPHQVVERYDQAQGLGPEVALFVHFDAQGRVVPTTRDFIRALGAAGLSVVFVTNSGTIQEEDKAFLRAHCAAVLIRRNIGYDFGAWRDALDTLGLPRAETRAIYMVNDSVYGPFGDLRPLLDAIDFSRAGLWGITESWQHHYHLQSFFLACGDSAIRSRAWSRFWRSVRPIPCKDWVIRHCEIGFTRALARGGVTSAALYPNTALLDDAELERLEQLVAADDESAGQDARLHAEAEHADRILRCAQRQPIPLNPSIDLWRQLLRAGYPFVKRELLLRNPTKVTDVFAWEEVVSTNLQVDPAPLAREIRRSLGPRLSDVWNPPSPLHTSPSGPRDAA